MIKLVFQPLDRRMTGYHLFKWRIEFTRGVIDSNLRSDATILFLEAAEHMTRELGFGPPLDEAHRFIMVGGREPEWAMRYAGNAIYSNALYFKAETAREAMEKFIVFKQLAG